MCIAPFRLIQCWEFAEQQCCFVENFVLLSLYQHLVLDSSEQIGHNRHNFSVTVGDVIIWLHVAAFVAIIGLRISDI